MKSFNIMLATFLVSNLMFGQKKADKSKYSVYGESFLPDKILHAENMLNTYANIAVGDSLPIAFKATTNSVCQAKGCWMTLRLNEENEVLVRFKDYGFFVPTDLDKQEVLVNGKAFVEEISVEEQRHYAKDAGKSVSEIAKISAPKKTLRFLATGVLIEN